MCWEFEQSLWVGLFPHSLVQLLSYSSSEVIKCGACSYPYSTWLQSLSLIPVITLTLPPLRGLGVTTSGLVLTVAWRHQQTCLTRQNHSIPSPAGRSYFVHDLIYTISSDSDPGSRSRCCLLDHPRPSRRSSHPRTWSIASLNT